MYQIAVSNEYSNSFVNSCAMSADQPEVCVCSQLTCYQCAGLWKRTCAVCAGEFMYDGGRFATCPACEMAGYRTFRRYNAPVEHGLVDEICHMARNTPHLYTVLSGNFL